MIIFLNFVDVISIIPIAGWLFGIVHGPDARHLCVLLLLISGGIQFFILKRKPNSFLWKSLLKLFQETSKNTKKGYFFVGICFMWLTVICALKTFSGLYAMMDQGVYNQLMWTLGNGFGFQGTTELQGNHFAVHFSPTLVLIWPISAILQYHPIAIALVSTISIWIGVLAWPRIVSSIPGISTESKNTITFGILVFAALFDPFWANSLWGFYESNLAFAFLSWGYAFYLQDKLWLSFVFFYLTAFTKELYLLDMAFLMFGISFIEKTKIKKLSSIFSAIFFLIVFFAYQSWTKNQINHKDFFKTFYAYLGAETLPEFIKYLVLNPTSVAINWWNQLGKQGGWFFPISTLLTMGFSPIFLFKKNKFKLSWLAISLIPSFFAAFFESTGGSQNFGVHYTMIFWPTLLLLSIPGFEYKSFGIPNFPLLLCIFLSILGGGQDYLKIARRNLQEIQKRKTFFEYERQIMPDESVMADHIGINLTARRFVGGTSHQLHFPNGCPNWIIIENDKVKTTLDKIKAKCTSNYMTVWSESGFTGLKELK